MINLLSGGGLKFAEERRLDLRHYGALLSPSAGNRDSLQKCISRGLPWAADNGCFVGYDAHGIQRLVNELEDMPGCAFFNAPDSFDRSAMCGDAKKTLQMFREWQPRIDNAGLPVALTLQNGITASMLRPFWDDLQAVFIGGDTPFKYSDLVRDLVAEANSRGKWVHMGRVNSARRILYAQAIGCTSFDGTGFCKYPETLTELHRFYAADVHQQLLI